MFEKLRFSAPSGALVFCLCTLAVAMAVAASSYSPPFGKWARLSPNPILSPQGDGFESAGTFNPSVVMKNGKFAMLYRAQDRKGTSSLGYATSEDGIHFVRRTEPVMVSETPYEKGGGVEDPRLVKFGDTYYLTYTGYNNVDGVGADKKDAQLCLATSTDLIHWKRQGIIFPAYQGKWNVKWTKSGAIAPEKINGKYWMYFLADARDKDTQMGVAYSEDLLHWTEALDHPVLSSRPGLLTRRLWSPAHHPSSPAKESCSFTMAQTTNWCIPQDGSFSIRRIPPKFLRALKALSSHRNANGKRSVRFPMLYLWKA